MIKLLPAFLFLPFLAQAQTAPDFTITTTDGVTRNLYSTLAQGKTVVLDFFYPTCQGCWYWAPVIEQSYQNHGAGAGNIEYWGINGGTLENDAAIAAYRTQYGITNPCASGLQGGGGAVDSLYNAALGLFSYPTYAVVCPDHSIAWNINNPPTATGFDSYLMNCGALSIPEPVQTPPDLSVQLDPSAEQLLLHCTLPYAQKGKLTLYSALGQAVKTLEVQGTQKISISATGLPCGILLAVLEASSGARASARIVIK